MVQPVFEIYFRLKLIVLSLRESNMKIFLYKLDMCGKNHNNTSCGDDAIFWLSKLSFNVLPHGLSHKVMESYTPAFGFTLDFKFYKLKLS